MTLPLPSKLAFICLGAAGLEYPGFQQTALRYFAKDHDVLWVNPTGVRRITANVSRHDLSKYVNKLKRLFAGTRKLSERIWVHDPFMIPLVYNQAIVRLNRMLLHRQFHGLIRRLGFDDYVLWIGSPLAAPFLDSFSPALTVYNPVDRFYAFNYVDPEKIKDNERTIAKRSDVIFCTADAIRDDHLPYNPETYTVNHGVIFERFHAAAAPLPRPADIAGLTGPILGFFGKISDWVDLPLLRQVAQTFPQAHLVLIGAVDADVSAVSGLPNVHLLGLKPHEMLPAYLSAFDVCLIPYVVNERLIAVDPTKLREYLSAGKAVVSSKLPEVEKHGDLVYVGDDANAFTELVGRALAENDPALRKRREDMARGEDWSCKMEFMAGHMAERLAAKSARGR